VFLIAKVPAFAQQPAAPEAAPPKLKLPAGFKVEVWSLGHPGARSNLAALAHFAASQQIRIYFSIRGYCGRFCSPLGFREICEV